MKRGPRPVAAGHVLVVGAGGIGCPVGWALADAGVGRVTIVDPDVVEPSNLPRQVLFRDEDVGRPKATVAAARLTGPRCEVRGVVARLDAATAPDLLAGVDVVVDAADTARTKDWIHALAVRRGLPVVHAAGVASEGRLLDVAAGGRPCLACLFGRPGEDADAGGTCADLGVWNGVVGTVGFLAAARALERLAQPGAPTGPYQVLDLAGGRAPRFRVDPDPQCPVCGAPDPSFAEPYPEAALCAPPPPQTRRDPDRPPAEVVDLVLERCPMNLLRARRAVEGRAVGEVVELLLGEEGAGTVPDGLARLGHRILLREPRGPGLRLRVEVGGRGTPSLDEGALRRYARQVILPEVGESGQALWCGARAEVRGSGEAAAVAAVYLRAAGVGEVVPAPGPAPSLEVVTATSSWVAVARPGGIGIATGSEGPAAVVPPAGPGAKALGALIADAALRGLLGGEVAPRAFVVTPAAHLEPLQNRP